jgi:hypothetical protein
LSEDAALCFCPFSLVASAFLVFRAITIPLRPFLLASIHRSAWKGCSTQFGCPVRLFKILH